MKKAFTYWILILMLSIGIVFLVQFLFREYRLNNIDELGHIGRVEFLFTSIFLPVYLTTVYWLIYKRFGFLPNFKAFLFLAVTCIVISSHLDFVNWWDTEGKIISIKDAETRDVIEIGLVLQLILALTINTIALLGIRKR